MSSKIRVELSSIAIILMNTLSERRWSMTHGFFIIMGGFHLFEHSSKRSSKDDRGISQEDDKPLHPLGLSDLSQCDDYESFTMPTKAEIEDKGKSDWLAKSLVLLQTSWFVIQCIARGIEHLPLTHLEIITLAYAAMNFVIYIFWWNKPLNVNRPVRVFRHEPSERHPLVEEPISETRRLTWRAIWDGLGKILAFIAGGQDNVVRLSREDSVPMFWGSSTGDEVFIADIIILGVGICFGAIHCIAWRFSFPTDAELLMWRISCVAITTIPVHIFLGLFLAVVLQSENAFGIVAIATLPVLILYIIARAVTLVLAFTSLRGLPFGAYETVHWTTFIPHI